MKKVSIRHSISRILLFSVVLLLSFSHTAFSQEEKESGQAASEASAEAAEGTSSEADVASMEGDPAKGKELFNSLCAACHKRYKRSTGPALHGVTDKRDKDWLYQWIKNSSEMIASGDPEAVAIYEEFNQTAMTAFPQLSNAEIDDILAYVEQPKPEPQTSAVAGGGENQGGSGSGVSVEIILGVLSFVLLLLIGVLVLVNKTLHRFAAANNIEVVESPKRKPIWKAFVENQFLVLVSAIFLLLVSAYFAYGYLMQVGVDQGYQPVQPIHYSHKIHAGDNQIECKYCHSSARVSKTSGIPSLNVCMNCHKSISEVAPETATEEYSKEFYDGEIAKLYDAVGWGSGNAIL